MRIIPWVREHKYGGKHDDRAQDIREPGVHLQDPMHGQCEVARRQDRAEISQPRQWPIALWRDNGSKPKEEGENRLSAPSGLEEEYW